MPSSTPRVLVVAGATGGLGRIVARDMAADGWLLALLGTNRERLAELGSQLSLDAERSAAFAADLRDGEAVGRVVRDVVARFGRLDALVQAVGGWTGGTPLAESSPDDLRSMLDQHVWTTYNSCTQRFP